VSFEKRSSYSSLPPVLINSTSSDKLNPDGTAPHPLTHVSLFRLQRIDFAGVDFTVCPYITVWPGVGGVQAEVGDADGARQGWGALGAGGDGSSIPARYRPRVKGLPGTSAWSAPGRNKKTCPRIAPSEEWKICRVRITALVRKNGLSAWRKSRYRRTACNGVILALGCRRNAPPRRACRYQSRRRADPWCRGSYADNGVGRVADQSLVTLRQLGIEGDHDRLASLRSFWASASLQHNVTVVLDLHLLDEELVSPACRSTTSDTKGSSFSMTIFTKFS
jgi:hypothetical protein